MALERCRQGHYYDPGMHTTCPHCGVPDLDLGRTVPRRPASEFATGTSEVRTQPRDAPAPGGSEPGVTVGVMREKIGIDPVVGWLVCVEGPDKGMDYRIRAENNSIGRSEQMRICIDGDDSVSRDNHALISFDPKSNLFTLVPGLAKGLVYLNEQAVFTPQPLHPFSKIQLGKTMLLFVPLCGELFQWTQLA
jgi:hypothetical protein